MNFQTWRSHALGRKIDIDHQFGDQCVDVDMDYVQFVWPKLRWNVTLGFGNAKDLFNSASSSYFTKIPYKQGVVPRQGDIAVFGATGSNPYGHTGAVDSANAGAIHLIQQDGFNPNGVCFEAPRTYNQSPVVGFLRPKTSLAAKVVQTVKPKPTSSEQFYVVHSGDTVDAICHRFGIAVNYSVKNSYVAFQKLNPTVKDVNKIGIGQKLRIK